MPGKLDIDAMKQVCQCLLGEHDFASFTGPTRKRTVREVHRAEITAEEDMVLFDIVANSFLSKQVRYITGTLIRVGQGRMSVDGFKGIMRAKKPGLASPVAPAAGLCLMKVNYNLGKGS